MSLSISSLLMNIDLRLVLISSTQSPFSISLHINDAEFESLKYSPFSMFKMYILLSIDSKNDIFRNFIKIIH